MWNPYMLLFSPSKMKSQVSFFVISSFLLLLVLYIVVWGKDQKQRWNSNQGTATWDWGMPSSILINPWARWPPQSLNILGHPFLGPPALPSRSGLHSNPLWNEELPLGKRKCPGHANPAQNDAVQQESGFSSSTTTFRDKRSADLEMWARMLTPQIAMLWVDK